MQNLTRTLTATFALMGLVLVAGCATRAEVNELRSDIDKLRGEMANTQQMATAASQSAAQATAQAMAAAQSAAAAAEKADRVYRESLRK